MAAPHVAGAWVVLKQINPAASVTQLLSTLQSTGTVVKDMRAGGLETGMPRINLDLAIGEPRTTFGIYNQCPGTLNISTISPQTPSPWISWTPQAPFTLQAGELKVVTVKAILQISFAGEGINTIYAQEFKIAHIARHYNQPMR